MIRRSLIALAALALLGGTVACGGGDDDEAAADDTEASTDGDEANADGDEAGDDAEGESGGASARPFGGGDSKAFCAEAKELDDADLDDANADDIADALDRLQALDPPPEIADAWETLLPMIEQVFAADAAGDLEAMEDIDFEAYMQAAQEIEAYLTEVCGLDAT